MKYFGKGRLAQQTVLISFNLRFIKVSVFIHGGVQVYMGWYNPLCLCCVPLYVSRIPVNQDNIPLLVCYRSEAALQMGYCTFC